MSKMIALDIIAFPALREAIKGINAMADKMGATGTKKGEK